MLKYIPIYNLNYLLFIYNNILFKKLFLLNAFYIDKFVANNVVEKADVNSLSMLVASVLSYNIEKMSVSKKIFQLSQLIIDFLLHCKKHSTFKFNDKV